MKRKEWKLAASALDVVLVKPTDEDVLWMPDIDSLLLRSQVRLRLGDKTGALEDALTVTQTLPLNHPKTPKAIVLKAQVRITEQSTRFSYLYIRCFIYHRFFKVNFILYVKYLLEF